MDNSSSGCWENLRDLLDEGELEVIEGDVRDRRVVRKVLKGVDAFVNLGL